MSTEGTKTKLFFSVLVLIPPVNFSFMGGNSTKKC